MTSNSPEYIQALSRVVTRENLITHMSNMNTAVKKYGRDQIADERYAHDPDVVVFPNSTEQVQDVLRIADRYGVPVTPRGAGTGLSGGAVPVSGGIVLSLERMNRILQIDPSNLTATVEPGVVTRDLDTELKPYGLFFAGYPMSEEICTIGGNVAENAGGGRAVKYGVTGTYVLGLDAVLPDGRAMSLGGKRLKDVTGYDLMKRIIGSEGTLAVITKIHLRLLPRPHASETMLALFNSTRTAISAIPEAIRSSGVNPASVEFMDSTCARSACSLTGDELPIGESGAVLLFEVDGTDRTTVHSELRKLAAVLEGLGARIERERSAEDNERFWNIRKKVPWALKRMGSDQSLEDISLPIAALAPMMERLAEIAVQYGIHIPSFGHAADGNLHCNPIRPESMTQETWRSILPEALADIYNAAKTLGGTISGEHGIGHKRKRYVRQVLDPVALDIMRSIKRTIDPKGILNPGKIFPD
ncbi:MAG: FAD-binding protein [Spirochaetaceae bacterium]|nr:MAG: FAD-binding protein [Spirochaetaceae bacterium]